MKFTETHCSLPKNTLKNTKNNSFLIKSKIHSKIESYCLVKKIVKFLQNTLTPLF